MSANVDQTWTQITQIPKADIPYRRKGNGKYRALWDEVKVRLNETDSKHAIEIKFPVKRDAYNTMVGLRKHADRFAQGTRSVVSIAYRANGNGAALYVSRGRNWPKN